MEAGLDRDPTEDRFCELSDFTDGTEEVVFKDTCARIPLCPLVAGTTSEEVMELWYPILLCTDVWSYEEEEEEEMVTGLVLCVELLRLEVVITGEV